MKQTSTYDFTEDSIKSYGRSKNKLYFETVRGDTVYMDYETVTKLSEMIYEDRNTLLSRFKTQLYESLIMNFNGELNDYLTKINKVFDKIYRQEIKKQDFEDDDNEL